jgi:hypothetical protein
MTTNIDQGWLSITTFENDGVRYAKLFSDIGPFSGDANTDLTVTVYSGSNTIKTITIHIWPKIDDNQITSGGRFGFSVSASGMAVTLTNTGNTAFSYSVVTWGDGFSNRSMTHTYTTAGTYSIKIDYMTNGGSVASAFGVVTVPSNSVEYSVYYFSNGGTGTMVSSSGQSIAVSNNGFTWENHTFLYWNTRADGKGTVFTPGTLINGLNADLNLYAIWKTGGGGGDGDSLIDQIINALTANIFGIPVWIIIVILAVLALLIIREVFD